MPQQCVLTFPDGTRRRVERGTPLHNLAYGNDPKPVLARINGRLCSLHAPVTSNARIQWICASDSEGIRAVQNTLCLLLIHACRNVFPESRLLIDHSLGDGLYCELSGRRVRSGDVKILKRHIRGSIAEDIPVQTEILTRREAESCFQSMGESPRLLESNRSQNHWVFSKMGDTRAFLEGPLLYSAGTLSGFDLKKWHQGMILRFPEIGKPDPLPRIPMPRKLFDVFQEYGRWESIVGIQKTDQLNEAVRQKTMEQLIHIAEGLHEKKIAHIADYLTGRSSRRLVLIAGPSSSGKTTFAKRLMIQLRVNGMRPLALSLDDYFLNRKHTPRNQAGEYDYESPASLDLKALEQDLALLMKGRPVKLRRYDFKTGRSLEGPAVRLQARQPVLLEGIHGLNHLITASVPSLQKLKIYVSALTQINITHHRRVPTSDIRLLRRLIRDSLFRGYSPAETLGRWEEVRRGESVYIFPFQESADIVFNSALLYELPVLRHHIEPLLRSVPEQHEYAAEARRLLELLRFVHAFPSAAVPPNSILREFIGKSSFQY